MPKKFRVAFVGVDHPHGAAWRESIAQLQEEVSITAIVPAFGGAIASLEEYHARLPRFSSVEELLSRGLELFDGAVICLPNSETPDAIARLAAAGKHVLAEKPLGRTAAETQPALDAVRRAGVAFQTGYLWRYDEIANRLREMASEGRFGRLISVEMTMATSDVQRRGPSHFLFDRDQSGGGFFHWLGCHYLDLLPFITGQRVTAVTARIGVFGATPVGVEDGGTVILELSGGALATLTGGYWLPRWTSEWRWTIRGSERWVAWDPNRAGTGGAIEIHGPQPQFHAMEEVFTLPPDPTRGYAGRRCLALLREWIANANGSPISARTTPESAIATLELVDAIQRSSREGRRIAIA